MRPFGAVGAVLVIAMASHTQALPSVPATLRVHTPRGSGSIAEGSPLRSLGAVVDGRRTHGPARATGVNLRLRGGDAAPVPVTIDWTAVMSSLLGGLSLFLYSIKKLGDGIRGAFGGELKTVLHNLSYNKTVSFLSGLVVCAVTQSLSLVAVLLVNFVSGELLQMESCIPILLGACVGSTFISYLVVFNITKYGLLFVFSGYFLNFTATTNKVEQFGDALFGLGLIFYSMELMSSAFSFVKHDINFLLFLAKMENPWLGMLVSTAFTGLIQSSGATMGILLSLSRQGMLGMDASMGLMLGANVGTCVTGLLAAIGQSRDALRLASVLMLIRILASLVVLPFHHQFSAFVRFLIRMPRKSKTPAKVTLFLATSHTVFNFLMALAVLPFTHQFARMIRVLIPDVPSKAHRPGRLTAVFGGQEGKGKDKKDTKKAV